MVVHRGGAISDTSSRSSCAEDSWESSERVEDEEEDMNDRKEDIERRAMRSGDQIRKENRDIVGQNYTIFTVKF